MKRCTFLAFGDLHHQPGTYYSDKEEQWTKFFIRSAEGNAEFIVGFWVGSFPLRMRKNRHMSMVVCAPSSAVYAELCRGLTTEAVIRSRGLMSQQGRRNGIRVHKIALQTEHAMIYCICMS